MRFSCFVAAQIPFRRSSVKQAGFPKLTVFAWAEIEAFNGDYFLTYRGETGHHFTYTWHRSLEKAMKQAKLDFSINVKGLDSKDYGQGLIRLEDFSS